MNKKGHDGIVLLVLVICGVCVVGIALVGITAAKPWFAQQDGKAELARAEQNRQITVFEAQAKKESAVLLAQAEIERAKGVAEANRIIGESLKENEGYLRYLYIQQISDNDNQIIYIPTEANLPIFESVRR